MQKLFFNLDFFFFLTIVKLCSDSENEKYSLTNNNNNNCSFQFNQHKTDGRSWYLGTALSISKPGGSQLYDTWNSIKHTDSGTESINSNAPEFSQLSESVPNTSFMGQT